MPNTRVKTRQTTKPGTERRRVVVRTLRDAPYTDVLETQKALQQSVIRGESLEHLLLVEHRPVITLGRSASVAHLLVTPEQLARQGIEVVEVGRGGDITYHGPGQLVAYPIFDLRPDRCDVRRYMRDLEAVVIDVCAHYRVKAFRREGLTGVWTASGKVAALGVRLSHWVSMHGLALNVTTPPEAFAPIVPCGLHGEAVTSLYSLMHERAPSWDAAAETLTQYVFERFERCAAAE